MSLFRFFLFSENRFQLELDRIAIPGFPAPWCSVALVPRDDKVSKLLLVEFCVGRGRVTSVHLKRGFEYIVNTSSILRRSLFARLRVDAIQFQFYILEDDKRTTLFKIAYWLKDLLKCDVENTNSLLHTSLGLHLHGTLDGCIDLRSLNMQQIEKIVDA